MKEKSLQDFSENLEFLTVDFLSKETGKSPRVIRSQLTRNGLACKDYDGKSRKVSLEKNANAASSLAAEQAEQAEILSRKNAAVSLAVSRRESDRIHSVVFTIFFILWVGISVWGYSANGAAFFLFWLLISFGLFMTSLMTGGALSGRAEDGRIKRMSKSDQVAYVAEQTEVEQKRRESLDRHSQFLSFGAVNEALICSNCHVKGGVRSKAGEDISSTQVVPIIGNKIKTRRGVTKMHCDNCGTTWSV